MPEANYQLRAARERISSRRVPREPMGRAELAEAVCAWLWDTTGQRYDLDARALGRYERGDVRWPGAAYRSALRHVLGVDTDAALGFTPTAPRVTSSMSPTLPAAGLEPWTLAHTLTRSTIDGTALDHMERAVHGYAQRYPSTPPNLLWPSVSAQITRLNDALSHPQPQRVRRRAVGLLGVLAGIAGNLWLDFDRRDQAARYFDVAELAAREADARDLAAWALATRSVSSFSAGSHHEATATLIRADHEAAYSDPRRRAWISALLARASAASGDGDTSRRALDNAHDHINAATEPASGTDFFDAARLDGVAGTTYLLLRDTARAAPLLSAALDRRAPEDRKGRAILGMDLAECRIHDGDTGEAAHLVITALDWADGAMVEPVVARARAVRDTLVRVAGTGSARELNERLQEISRDK